ncbi:MAG: peptidylprolyl isomerase, partial [Rhodocyclaceae bacterium]
PVATVNGIAIPPLRAQIALQQALQQGIADTPQTREAVRSNLINGELLLQAAQKQGLDRNPEVQERMALASRAQLIAAYQETYLRAHPITDAEVTQEYNALRGRMGDTEYEVSHILVGSEAEARALIVRLGKGESFDTLARQSIDAGTRDKGGNLGWNPPSAYVPAFADAVKALRKGQTASAPVKTEYGWHVIRLNDTRNLSLPPLAEATPRIREVLARKRFETHLAELRQSARIVENK